MKSEIACAHRRTNRWTTAFAPFSVLAQGFHRVCSAQADASDRDCRRTCLIRASIDARFSALITCLLKIGRGYGWRWRRSTSLLTARLCVGYLTNANKQIAVEKSMNQLQLRRRHRPPFNPLYSGYGSPAGMQKKKEAFRWDVCGSSSAATLPLCNRAPALCNKLTLQNHQPPKCQGWTGNAP